MMTVHNDNYVVLINRSWMIAMRFTHDTSTAEALIVDWCQPRSLLRRTYPGSMLKPKEWRTTIDGVGQQGVDASRLITALGSYQKMSSGG